jgi:xanthine dehydrogenase accessory factor
VNGPLHTIVSWVAAGRQVALATVAATQWSAPEPIGATMAVNDHGGVCGAVSGGCVESDVINAAEHVLGGGPPRLLHYGSADDPAGEVGLPCGGELTVWLQRLVPATNSGRFLALASAGERAALVTAVAGQVELGAQLLVPGNGDPSGSLGSPRLDQAALELARRAIGCERGGIVEPAGACARLFVDVATRRPRLLIVGASELATCLSAVASLAGWRAFVLDPRARLASAERFPGAERVIVAWPQKALAQLAPLDDATAIVTLTHDPKLDDAALIAALASDAAYVGAIGSRRAHQRRCARLRAAGVSEAALQRLAAPLGLDLGAIGAGETALSIMSEIVALRHGRGGGRLTGASGRIHGEAATTTGDALG